jgi:hypothetical protein
MPLSARAPFLLPCPAALAPLSLLLAATRRVNAATHYHARTLARKNPQKDAWDRLGAARLQPAKAEPGA